MDVLTLLNTAAYLVLAVVVGVRARQTGQLALHRLALYLLGISATLAGARLLEEPVQVVGLLTLLVALLVYPVLLLRFGAAVARHRRRWLERAAVVVVVAEVLAIVVTTAVGGGGRGLVAAIHVVGSAAGLAHVAVVVALVQQATGLGSGFLRVRAMTLASSIVLLGASFLVGMFGAQAFAASGTVALVGGIVAAAMLAVASSPPRWLQAAFVLRDHDALMAAEARLLRGDDPTALTDLLGGLVRLVGGDGAALTAGGEVVASVGEVPAEAIADTDTSTAHALRTDAGTVLWVLSAEAVGCRLAVVTGEDPIMYGLDVADLVPRTAARIGVALASRSAEDRRRAQAQAEQEAAHYRQMADLKDDLLSTINHELRTPMTLVSGGLELLVHRWEAMTDEQRQHLVERAHDHAGQLMGVVDQVLALAGLRSGEVVPNSAPVSSRTVVAAALDGLDDDGRVHETGRVAAWLATDTDLLARTVRELVDNALRHTAGEVEVGVAVEGEDVRFTVTDRGPGFDVALQDELARGGHYLHRTTRGLGLGLTLATETMDVLGGRLQLEAGPDGTTASCVLPVAPVPASPATTEPVGALHV